jgi:hypothetical protein
MEALSPNLTKKQQTLLQSFKNTQSVAHLNPQIVELAIHGIPLRFYLSSEELVSELYDHYPLSWFQPSHQAKPIEVFWTDNQTLGWTNEEWSNEATPNCHVLRFENKQIALQRDFAAMLENQSCHLVCPYHVDDGFFNFLRWLLPVLLLERGKLVLHSSCILDDQGRAYFSLGVSGAGKSTISSFRARKKVLGDDMNVIKFADGKCWAQAGAMGQALLNPVEYSNWYPVEALFWLKKGEQVSLKELPKAAQIRLLSSSVANVFWDQLPQHHVQNIFRLVCHILAESPLYELSFPKREKIWDEIFATLREVKQS